MTFEEEFKDDIIVPFRNGKQFIDIETVKEKCIIKQKFKEIIEDYVFDHHIDELFDRLGVER